jgi:hypothetical protein
MSSVRSVTALASALADHYRIERELGQDSQRLSLAAVA